MQVPVGYNLLIDGYNLMHAAGFARRRYGPGELERWRERFLRWLCRHLPAELQSRTVVIFDAPRTRNLVVEAAIHGKLRIYFAPFDLEADDLIEELIAAHSAPKSLRVVSSDRRLKRAAEKRKAKTLSSERFFDWLQRTWREAQSRENRQETKPSDESPEQTAHWEQVFAEAQDLAAQEQLLPPDEPFEDAAKARTSKAGQAESPQPVDIPPAPSIPADEVTFWEKRLRDLLEGDDW